MTHSTHLNERRAAAHDRRRRQARVPHPSPVINQTRMFDERSRRIIREKDAKCKMPPPLSARQDGKTAVV